MDSIMEKFVVVLKSIAAVVLDLFVLLILMIPFIYNYITSVPDLREPLNKDQIYMAVNDHLASFNQDRRVKRISLRQGGLAGDLGYYFVELEPFGYLITINDARFFIGEHTSQYYTFEKNKIFNIFLLTMRLFIGKLPKINYEPYYYEPDSPLNFFEFIASKNWRGCCVHALIPCYESSSILKVRSFLNMVINKKTPQQIFWQQY